MIGRTAVEIGIWARLDDRDTLVQQIKAHGRVQNWPMMVRRRAVMQR